MTYYRYKVSIIIESSLITPLHADTIWGHICWGIKYFDGEHTLINFLKMYEEDPPLVLSHAFPKGLLPKPVVKSNFSLKKLSLEKYREIKKFKKTDYVKETDLSFYVVTASKEKNSRQVQRIHNVIDRLSGYVEEDGLFAVDEYWFEKKEFVIYVVSYFDKDEIKRYFENAFRMGYGADKSTGKGRIKVEGIKEWIVNTEGNRYLALSNFVLPKGLDIEDLQSDIFVKYGKLGGDYVLYKNPFKKPIVFYKAGATFKHNGDVLFIGTILGEVHKDPLIRHYAIAPVIPFEPKENSL